MVPSGGLGAEPARVPIRLGPWSDVAVRPLSLLPALHAAYHARMARIPEVSPLDFAAVHDATAVDAPRAAPPVEPRARSGRWPRPGRVRSRGLPSLRGTSLATRFLLASLAILLVAGV